MANLPWVRDCAAGLSLILDVARTLRTSSQVLWSSVIYQILYSINMAYFYNMYSYLVSFEHVLCR